MFTPSPVPRLKAVQISHSQTVAGSIVTLAAGSPFAERFTCALATVGYQLGARRCCGVKKGQI